MAQSGFTPISLYYSSTATNAPSAANLVNGELAINITDGKLFYKDNAGTVQLLASKAAATGVLSFQTSLSGLTPSTATNGAVTLAGTLGAASGGTGATTLTGYVYGNGTSAMTASTTIPTSALSGNFVSTFSAGTTGFTPSTATSGAVTLAGTLATTNGGTGLTSFTSGGAIYATSTSALASGTLPITSGGTGITAFGTGVQTALGQNVTGSNSIVLNSAPSITNPTITNYVETLYTATGNTTVSLSNGTIQEITTSGSTTITLPSSVAGKSYTIIVKYNAADALTWSSSSTLKWAGGTTPTPTSATGKYDIFNFYNDGTNVYGAVYGQNF